VAIVCTAKAYSGDGRQGSVATLDIAPAGDLPQIEEPARSVLFVAPSGWLRQVAGEGLSTEAAGYYLPEAVQQIVGAILQPRAGGLATDLYRAARSQELFCEIIELWRAQRLTSRVAGTSYSLAESERLMEARRVIATRYGEKLTLEAIARACGLNRAKLTKGFRELFGVTVADALTEQRLAWAAQALGASGKAVAQIGYAAGYQNNASFTRAFSNRFGQCPTAYRRAATTPQAALV
jgi:AraC family transcriptional activator of pyochelin receptor